MNVKVTRHNKRLDEHRLKSNLQQQSNNLSANTNYWCKKDHFQQSVLSRHVKVCYRGMSKCVIAACQSVLSQHVKSPIFIPVVELDKNAPKQKTN